MSHRRSIAKSTNVFSVRLPADLDVDASDFNSISAVHPDTFDGGSYIIDFLDRSIALRYQQRADDMRRCQSSSLYDTSAEHTLFPPGLGHSEEIVAPLGLDQIPEPFGAEKAEMKMDYKFPHATEHEVRIQGLPKNLLKEVMISAIMEQANLDNHVVSIDVKISAKQSMASIKFVSVIAAVECVRHCHGQKWNPSGPPVSACLIPKHARSSRIERDVAQKPNPQRSMDSQQKMMNAQRSTSYPSWLKPDAPAYVHSIWTGDSAGKKMTANSDASTTISDSDVDDEQHGLKTLAWLSGR